MAVRRQSSPIVSEPLSLFRRLNTYLFEAIQSVKQSDLLIIPLDVVNGFLQSSTSLEEAELSSIVALIDGHPNRGNCTRFDLVSFHCMLVILLRAPPCISRDRAFFLFLESMRELSSIQHSAVDDRVMAAALQRKVAIGQRMCHVFFWTLVQSNSSLPRRWSGQFILELIHDSEDNKKQLLLAATDIRVLGNVVLSDSDYCLRLISATIIRDMISAGFDPASFWPIKTNVEAITAFPLSSSTQSDTWMKEINRFIRNIDGDGGETFIQQVASISIPGLSLDSQTYSITVVVSKYAPLLMLIMNGIQFQLIHVPMDNIDSTKQLQNSPSGLQIELRNSGCYMMNGRVKKIRTFTLETNNSNQAEDMAQAIENLKGSRTVKGKNGNTSYETSASTSFIRNDTRTDAFAAPKSNIIAPIAATMPPARIRRMVSSAAIELPLGDQVLHESKKFLQDAQKVSSDNGNTEYGNVQDMTVSDFESLEQVKPANNKGQLIPEMENSMSSLEPEANNHGGMRVNSTTHIVHSVELSNGEGNMSIKECGGPDMDRAAAQKDGLPSLAQQALQLQLPDIDTTSVINTTSITQDLQDCKNLSVVQEMAPENVKRGENITRVPDSQPANTPDIEEVCNMDPNPASKPSDGLQNVKNPTVLRDAVNVAPNSRLKRPIHKLTGPSTKVTDVDWDEGLRTDDDDDKINHAVSAKKQKQTPRDKGTCVLSKERKQSTSTNKKSAKKVLPLSPEVASTGAAQKKRTSRQVTKTLTSSRQRRTAANEASRKMAIATEQENAAYDLDDPIESSSPEPNSIGISNAHVVVNQTILDKPDIKDDTQGLPTAHQNTLDLRRPLPGNEDMQKALINAIRSEAKIQASSGKVGPEELAGPDKSEIPPVPQSPTSCIQDRVIINLCSDSAEDSNKPCHQEDLADNAYGKDAPNNLPQLEQSDKDSLIAVKTQTLTERLAETLANAGILQSKKSECKGLEEIEFLSEDPDHPEQSTVGGHVSQISKCVTQFITRQLEESKRLPQAKKLEPNPVPTSIMQTSNGGSCGKVNLHPPNNSMENDIVHPNSESNKDIIAEVGNLHGESYRDSRREVDKQAQRQTRVVQFDFGEASNKGTAVDKHEEHATECYSTPSADANNVKSTSAPMQNSSSLADISDNLDHVSSTSLQEDIREAPDAESRYRQLTSSSLCELTNEKLIGDYMPFEKAGIQSQTVDENGSPRPKNPAIHDSRVSCHTVDHGKRNDSKQETCRVFGVTSSFPRRSGARSNKNRGLSKKPSMSRLGIDHSPQEQEGDSIDSSIEIRHKRAGRSINRVFMKNTKQPFNQQGIKRPLDRLKESKLGHERATRPTFAERLRVQRKWPYPTNSGRKKRVSGQKLGGLKKVSATEGDKNRDVESEDVDSEAETYTYHSSPSTISMPPTSISSMGRKRKPRSRLQRDMRDSQKTSMDIMLGTSNRLMHQLLKEERRIFRVVDTYGRGGQNIVQQLEDTYNKQLSNYKNNIEPIRKKLTELLDGASKRLDNDNRSLQSTPSLKSLSTTVGKERRKLLDEIEAAVTKQYETRALSRP